MTKVIFNIATDIMFDCINHANDHDVCTIASTLCNVLVDECFHIGGEPTVYNPGHVRIDITNATEPVTEVFRTVERQFRHVAKQYPENIKVY